MKTKLGPTEIFFPLPAALVACGTMEKPNIITVAWICMVDNAPPTIGFSLRHNRYSLELIRKHKEFSVNVPSAEHVKETDYCGIYSGKNVDKFKETGFTPIKGSKIGAPIIKECHLSLECSLAQEIKINERLFIVGTIIETQVDSDLVLDEASMKIDSEKLNPLVYFSRIREYWSVGKKLGNGFSIGKKL